MAEENVEIVMYEFGPGKRAEALKAAGLSE